MDLYLAGLANLSGTCQRSDEEAYYANRRPECRSIVWRALAIGLLLICGLIASL